MNRDIDDSSENVLSEWGREEIADDPDDDSDEVGEPAAWGTASTDPDGVSEPHSIAVRDVELEPAVEAPPSEEPIDEEPAFEPEPAGDEVSEVAPMAIELSHEHAAGELEIPDGYAVLEGEVDGGRRAVGVVVSRFNGAVTSRLLERALVELESAGVRRDAITIMVVPGAFELALAATALAKTRRFACIVALGCVIRGDTPHFDYVASEAASGLQLAALETGVPVSFGVLTLERVEQADARIEKGSEAVRSALEMADVFSHLRAAASR
jgi:6,7-dimethyl-8-ribityllumazine synthase